MRPSTRRLAPWIFAVVSSLASAACSSPGEVEEDGDTADELSAAEAARSFKGTEKVRIDLQPGGAARNLGIASWTVYAINNESFTGAVLFAVDAAGDVKHAVLTGRKAHDAAGKTSIALVNYDKDGRTGASSADRATLEALGADVIAIQFKLLNETRDKAKCMQAIGIAAAGVAVAVAGWWLAVPISVAAGGWVGSVLFATGTGVTAAGGWTLWAGAAVANLEDGAESCGALLRR